MTAKTNTPTARALLLAAASFSAGLLNGLLGTGGGMILVFTLSKLLSPTRGKEVFVLSSVGVAVFSLVSATFYGTGGNLDTARLPLLALGGMAGGLLGALLLERISLFWLRKIFALLLLYSGLKLTGVI